MCHYQNAFWFYPWQACPKIKVETVCKTLCGPIKEKHIEGKCYFVKYENEGQLIEMPVNFRDYQKPLGSNVCYKIAKLISIN